MALRKVKNFTVKDIDGGIYKLGGYTSRYIDDPYGISDGIIKGEIVGIDVGSFHPKEGDLRLLFIKNRRGIKLSETKFDSSNSIILYNKDVKGLWVSANDKYTYQANLDKWLFEAKILVFIKKLNKLISDYNKIKEVNLSCYTVESFVGFDIKKYFEQSVFDNIIKLCKENETFFNRNIKLLNKYI